MSTDTPHEPFLIDDLIALRERRGFLRQHTLLFRDRWRHLTRSYDDGAPSRHAAAEALRHEEHARNWQPDARGRHPLLLTVLLLAACAGQHKPESAPKKKVHPVALQAQFDLNCKRADLRYMKLSDEQWGAVGCGRRARYRRFCDQRLKQGRGRTYDIENRCHWTLDSPVMTQEPSISEAPVADAPNSGI